MSEGAAHRPDGFENEAVAVPEHRELAERGGGVNDEAEADRLAAANGRG